MFLAMEAWNAILRNSDEAVLANFRTAVISDVPHAASRNPVDQATAEAFADNIRHALGVAALLHDVGHPPFSHALEWIYAHWASQILGGDELVSRIAESGLPFHEHAGFKIATDLAAKLPTAALAGLVTSILDRDNTKAWASALRSLVSSEIDIDRIDYLMRDNKAAGTEYGAFDYERLISSVQLGEVDGRLSVGFGSRARSGAEQLLLQRTQTYRWVIFHPRVVAADHAVARSVDMLLTLAESETEVQLDANGSARVGDLFGSLVPNLDYLNVEIDDLSERFGVPAARSIQLGHELDLPGIVSQARASVDDGTVVNWIQSGITMSQLLLTSAALDTTLRRSLEQLVLFGSTVTVRGKHMIPLWKNFEEYEETARAIVEDPSFLAAIEQSWLTLAAEYGETDLLQVMRSKEIAMLHAFDPSVGRRSAVEVFNYFADIVVDRAGADLAAYLNAHSPQVGAGRSGFWEATFRDFRPLMALQASSKLFKGPNQVSLQETSPLVRSLQWVDAQRPKLFAFFCQQHRQPDVAAIASVDMRRDLRGRFVELFVPFIGEYYPLAQREWFEDLESNQE
jgi:hypothetical protein